MKVGLHVSISNSIISAIERAKERNCDIFQIFTKNPRTWFNKNLSDETVKNFHIKIQKEGMDPIFVHMPYLPNIASSEEEIYQKSVDSLKFEIKKCFQLEIPYLVIHLGSHCGKGFEQGLERIVKALNNAQSEVRDKVSILMENTAFNKNSMGSNLSNIAKIIKNLKSNKNIGVCYDTCHGFASGYDIRTKQDIKKLLIEFDDIIGLDRLFLIHLNDSVGDLGSGLDRHEHIGFGKIGIEGFKNFLNSPFREIPIILETPIDNRRSNIENIKVVRKLLIK